MNEPESGTRLEKEGNMAATQEQKDEGGEEGMKELMCSVKECVMESIERNPYQALAIAAGIGFVTGLILKRR